MKYFFALLSFLLTALSIYFFIIKRPNLTPVDNSLPTFTAASIAKYDGTDPNLPIYVAMDGAVYDVTEGKKFYDSNGPYHYLAGKDSSGPLSLIGGDIIKRKYPVIGRYLKN